MDEKLKKILFIKAESALAAYHASMLTKFPSEEAKRRHEHFQVLWDLIEEAHLEEDFERWKEG